ncbi:MAG: hypothetical protein Q4D39_00400, partial [Coriobacteriaceae bacterium]|nr:hypothetical protein [Coriobacteriaceae bacterium]
MAELHEEERYSAYEHIPARIEERIRRQLSPCGMVNEPFDVASRRLVGDEDVDGRILPCKSGERKHAEAPFAQCEGIGKSSPIRNRHGAIARIWTDERA